MYRSPLAPARRMTRLTLVVVSLVSLGVAGCGSGDGAPAAETTWLSVATGGTGGVYYPYGGGIAKVLTDRIDGVEATAEVTAGTVDNLKFLADGGADLAFALADSLDDALAGRGPFVDFGPVPARALAVLYSNYTHVVTLASSGIDRIEQLAGQIVSTGAPGSGTEIIARRVLEAAGLDPSSDVTAQSLGAAQSVDALRDGKIDAFFWSGGLPTGSVLDLASTPGITIKLLPSDEALPRLQAAYGDTAYQRVTVPREAYPDLESDVPVVGVANVLAVHEDMPADLAYLITQALFDHHADLVAIHSEAENLTLASAVRGSTAPYHDGAIRFYRERGVWPDATSSR